VAGLVLAGGRGSRMGGADKGLLLHEGRPLAARVLDRLAGQVDELMLCANRNLPGYRALAAPHGANVITDTVPGQPGPLAGMLAGLQHSALPWLAVVPCDAPLLPTQLVERLLVSARTAGQPAAVAQADGRLQPTFCLLHRGLAPALAEAIAHGHLAAGRWLAAVGAVAVPFPQPGAFANLNHPQDLARHGG
jgi:molybdopterin-guanine dinucleotide biosynthesis protein A